MLEETMRTIKAKGEAAISKQENSASAKALMDNIDFIGEEENFKVCRTIGAEQRYFHGQLKTEAYQVGMRDMLDTILSELSKS